MKKKRKQNMKMNNNKKTVGSVAVKRKPLSSQANPFHLNEPKGQSAQRKVPEEILQTKDWAIRNRPVNVISLE
jgi:hypothetical protein